MKIRGHSWLPSFLMSKPTQAYIRRGPLEQWLRADYGFSACEVGKLIAAGTIRQEFFRAAPKPAAKKKEKKIRAFYSPRQVEAALGAPEKTLATN